VEAVPESPTPQGNGPARLMMEQSFGGGATHRGHHHQVVLPGEAGAHDPLLQRPEAVVAQPPTHHLLQPLTRHLTLTRHHLSRRRRTTTSAVTRCRRCLPPVDLLAQSGVVAQQQARQPDVGGGRELRVLKPRDDGLALIGDLWRHHHPAVVRTAS
jgi:hypothetical protein